MNLKFSELKLKILRLLADEVLDDVPIGGAGYSADILKDGVYAALDAITSRIWKTGTFDIAGSLTEKVLPDGVIDIQAVFDNELNIFLPKMQFQIGQGLSSTTGNAWHLYPTGKLVFVNELGATGAKAFFTSKWSKPVSDSDLIDPPEHITTCLLLYTAAYCLLGDTASSASIRQFNTKVDSGAPSDIPAKTVSDFLMRRFEAELQRIPMMEKSRTL